MIERFLHHVRTELPAADETAAAARVRLAEKFPRNAVRRMTHLGLLVGSYVFAELSGKLDATLMKWGDRGKLTLPELLHVRLPTMTRITLPALSNTFISLFKDTSIASVIAVPELTWGAQWINNRTFRIVEVYAVTTVIYLVVGYLILFGLRLLERSFRVER